MSTKKIIHFISSLSRGGRERQLAMIVSNTDHNKCPTKIIFFNIHKNSYLEEYDLEKHTLQIKSKGKISRMKELHQILKIEKPDIVYTWGNAESLSILILKSFHKFKIINGSIRHGIRSKKFSHYLRTLILHLSPHIVANSKAGLRANRLRTGHILYNGIEKKFLAPINNRKAIRKELTGISNNMPILISVANFVPYKDYNSIIKALKLIADEKYPFYYVILGDGPLRQSISSSIDSNKLTNCIKIIGNVENVSEYLKISDIFIHSSKGEGCSNAILEAMASGLPIIATNTGGTPELVNDSNGFLYDYTDHVKLYTYLKYCINNLETCKKMGTASSSIIHEKFLVNSMMQNYYSILHKISGS